MNLLTQCASCSKRGMKRRSTNARGQRERKRDILLLNPVTLNRNGAARRSLHLLSHREHRGHREMNYEQCESVLIRV